MNLEKLLEIQGGLDYHIIKQHPEIEDLGNNDWKFLALQVEIGELANEWRGFKYWSNDREPRTEYKGEEINLYGDGEVVDTIRKKGKPGNPLLEEYVDGLHLILSIGNDMHIVADYLRSLKIKEVTDINQAFLRLFRHVSGLNRNLREEFGNNAYFLWTKMYYMYLDLGNALGFTEDDIETAYLLKNTENHLRQRNGY